MTDLDPAGYDLLRQLEQAGVLTPTGLTLTDPHLPISTVEAIGSLLGRMHMSVKFAVGDWLLFIEAVYPSEWSQMSEVLGMSERTRGDYMRVAQQVPRKNRRPSVQWSHHRAVAALPPPEQKQWLDKVEKEGLSHQALRDALREGEPPDSPSVCRCCHRPL